MAVRSGPATVQLRNIKNKAVHLCLSFGNSGALGQVARKCAPGSIKQITILQLPNKKSELFRMNNDLNYFYSYQHIGNELDP